MKRLGFLAILMWAVLVVRYWNASVPVRADAEVALPRGTEFRGFLPTGEAMLVHPRHVSVPEIGRFDFGPVEVWRYPENIKVREVFRAEDRLVRLFATGDGRIVVIRDGRVWLADVQTGALLQELPGLETKAISYGCVRGGRLIWICKGSTEIYDLANRRVLATFTGEHQLGSVSEGWIVLYTAIPAARGGLAGNTIRLINLQTGEVDDRFAGLGKLDGAVFSGDSRFVVLTQGTTVSAFDVATAELRWTTQLPYQVVSFGFEGDDVLTVDVTDKNHEVCRARWNLDDGEVLTPFPQPVTGFGDRDGLPGARFAVDHVRPKPWFLLELCDDIVRNVMWSTTGRVPAGRAPAEATRIVDLTTGHSVGLLGNYYVLTASFPDDRGVLAADEEDYRAGRFRFYSLPPSRDWWWLVRWGLGPVVGVAVAAGSFRVRRLVRARDVVRERSSAGLEVQSEG